MNNKKKIVSLFSVIGGLEFSFEEVGFETILFCESDIYASQVLRKHYPATPISTDIRELEYLPDCDLITAGFPCQDLSQAGKKSGLQGENSGLVSHVFRLLQRAGTSLPSRLIIENVPYLLRLKKGAAMEYLVNELEGLGYRWAYRVIDARSFGLPQRRPRLIIYACKNEDPKRALFSDSDFSEYSDTRPSEIDIQKKYGFYWTEGSRGVGWAVEAVPPIKGGSSIGIPSPPAVWEPMNDFAGTIDIRDAERLQGFPADWTEPAQIRAGRGLGARWRLVGNAVSTRISRWLAQKIDKPIDYACDGDTEIKRAAPWPKAAWGEKGRTYKANVSTWAADVEQIDITDFLEYELKPLSERATRGFLRRAAVCSNVVYSEQFINSLKTHADNMAQ